MKHIDLKIDFFNELAGDWDGMTTPPSGDRLAAIVSLACIRQPAMVLDAGCGTGILVLAILGAIGEHGGLVAIDPAKRMLDSLNEKYRDRRIDTRCETLEDCALPSASLDAIICFSCFPHVSDKEKALANVKRMLKEEGNLLIAHVSSRDEINSFHAGCSGPVRHDVLPNEGEMRRLMQNAGLHVTHFRDEPGRYELVARLKANSKD